MWVRRLALVLGLLLWAGVASAQEPKIGEATVAWFSTQRDPVPGPYMQGALEALAFLGLRCKEPLTKLTTIEVLVGLRGVARESSPEELRQAPLMGSVLVMLAGRGCSLDARRAVELQRAMDAARGMPR